MDSESIYSLIVAHLSEVVAGLDARTVGRGDSLESLGANSVDRSEIVMLTLESLDLAIPLIDTFGPENIGELANLLFKRLHER